MLEYITTLSNGQIVFLIGVLCLIVEIAILSMSTVVLLFLGISFSVVGLLSHYTMIPLENTYSILLAGSILASILTFIFWKKLKSIQNNDIDTTNTQSDIVGSIFTLEQATSKTEHSIYYLFGIQWKVYSDKTNTKIPSGTDVIVTSVEVGKLYVKAC